MKLPRALSVFSDVTHVLVVLHVCQSVAGRTWCCTYACPMFLCFCSLLLSYRPLAFINCVAYCVKNVFVNDTRV